MTAATAAPSIRLLAKDARALATAGGATLAALAAEHVLRGRFLALPMYVLGAAMLGALAIGHEYSHRTLGQLLAQPIRRAQVLLLKLILLAVMLSLIAAAAWILELRSLPRSGDSDTLAALVLPAMLALTVAPWLSMVSRTAMGGAVLSMALPGFLWTVIMLAYVRVYGEQPPWSFTLAVFWRGGLTLAAVGAVMTWFTFQRLEVNDGPVAEVRLPSFGAAAGAVRRGSPLVRLFWKDLYLQQMPIAIAVLYCAAWPLFVGLGGRYLEVFSGLSLFFPVTIALLSGALSSAEERQLGTLDAQMLLPIAASTQWTVKVVVALALTLVVGIGLPWVFMRMVPIHETPAPAMLVDRPFLFAIVGLLVASLYVSSLMMSGIRAAVVTVPTVLAFVAMVAYFDSWFRRNRSIFWKQFEPFTAGSGAMEYLPYAMAAGFLLMLLWFAFVNHRSGDHSVRRIAPQIASIAVFVIAFVVLTAVVFDPVPSV